jgi:RNA polymerase sporulation-specific sigma factor
MLIMDATTSLAEPARRPSRRVRANLAPVWTVEEQNTAIEDHYLMVCKAANRYRGRSPIPLEDLVQIGCIELIRCARDNDPSRGLSFTSFACFNVRRALRVAVAKAWARRRPLLETDITYDDWSPLCAAPDRLHPTPDAEPESGDDHAWLMKTMEENLTERERRILILRYGLDRAPPAALEAVGSALGITRQRAYQIEKRAIEILQMAFLKKIKRAAHWRMRRR